MRNVYLKGYADGREAIRGSRRADRSFTNDRRTPPGRWRTGTPMAVVWLKSCASR
jgi:hypothetical protein